jgi:hypothetical protein
MPAKIMSQSIFSAQFQKRFVSGHDFSRAAKAANEEGFSPCGASSSHFGFGQLSALNLLFE